MADRLRSIGETVALLRPEFPDITVSKVRFLEAEGLVAPLRTPSGYRKFRPEHIDRIRYVLATQRDHYLPLKVIAEHLDAMDRGLEPPRLQDSTPRAPKAPIEGDPALLDLDTGVRLTADELCREAGLDRSELHDAVDQGLLGGQEPYDLNDVECARAIAAMAPLGVAARNLRAVRLAVQREVDLHATALGARRAAESEADYEARRVELTRRILDLHVSLARRALR